MPRNRLEELAFPGPRDVDFGVGLGELSLDRHDLASETGNSGICFPQLHLNCS